jgi:hypothetical protein
MADPQPRERGLLRLALRGLRRAPACHVLRRGRSRRRVFGRSGRRARGRLRALAVERGLQRRAARRRRLAPPALCAA